MRVPFLAVRTRSADETTDLGRRLGEIVKPGEVLLLSGELGAGKTTFVQGFATGLELPERPTSPSYTIVRSHAGGRYPFVHVDLYRCSSPSEVLELGLEEMMEPPAVTAVEWGEKAAALVGEHYLELEFVWDPSSDDARKIVLRPFGRWFERMGELSETVRDWSGAA